MCGSFRRVLVMLMTGTAMREPGARAAVRLADVGPARLVELLDRAGAFGRPISGNWLAITRPPRSNTRKTSPGGTRFPAGSG